MTTFITFADDPRQWEITSGTICDTRRWFALDYQRKGRGWIYRRRWDGFSEPWKSTSDRWLWVITGGMF